MCKNLILDNEEDVLCANEKGRKLFKFPVQFTSCGDVYIRANNIDEAVQYLSDKVDGGQHLPLKDFRYADDYDILADCCEEKLILL